ncbi:MAG TPA: hypothetical protein PKW79_04030, partial [Rhabdochlamydiaceae bacterium]|nr:hypothetical protein [Rhabdochlamydiaceae bacterium]
MNDVSKLSGGNPLDPGPAPRGPTKPGSDKFKEMMKVGDSEKRQKRGKKRQSESEEELKAELRSGAISTDKEVQAAQKGAKVPKIQQVGEAEKRQPGAQKRAEETISEAADEVAATNLTSQKITQVRIDGELEELETRMGNLTSQDMVTDIVSDEKVEEEMQQIEEKDEVSQESTFKQQMKKESVQQEISQAVFPASSISFSTLGPSFIAPASATPPAYATLNSEMLALFEKMVGVIAVMKENGINETIIHLNSAEYANSRFAGSQIVIREFSTAPMAYNIELIGTPQNTALFEQNVGSLMNAFQGGHHNFTVNRIDTRIASQRPDKPVFHRKETSS